MTRTADELSIVCEVARVPHGINCEADWCCLRVAGTMPFSMVGVLSSLTAPLAAAGVSLFAMSTFDTDYLLIKSQDVERAIRILRGAGHNVKPSK